MPQRGSLMNVLLRSLGFVVGIVVIGFGIADGITDLMPQVDPSGVMAMGVALVAVNSIGRFKFKAEKIDAEAEG